MGAKGIKPRKPRRRLRPLKNYRIEDPAPGHVMWPEKGSGFEPSTYSPAGRAQQAWVAVGNVRRYGVRIRLWPLVAVPLAAIAIVAVGTLLVWIVGLIL